MSACGGIGPLVATGDLYAARRAALDHCAASAPDHSWLHQAADAAATCVAAWRAAVDALHEDGDGWAAISDAHRLRAPRVRAMAASMHDCATDSDDVIASWDECCSAHVRTTPGRACGPTACCTFGNGTKNYLKLPLLREISISLALPSGDLLTIEQASAPYPRVAITVSHHHFPAQDGFLRPLHEPSVLWPAGYLLAQFVAHPPRCASWRGKRVLELGAGVGMPPHHPGRI